MYLKKVFQYFFLKANISFYQYHADRVQFFYYFTDFLHSI